jgi:YHS domain-containing protein
MIRFLAILIASILLISLLRAIIGVVMKGFAGLFSEQSNPLASKPQQPDVPLAGELKRDPVCGTYVSTASSVKKTIGGEVLHFCSIDCRDKHKV